MARHQSETLLTYLELATPIGSLCIERAEWVTRTTLSITAAHQQPLTNSTKACLTHFCKVRVLQGEIPNIF